MNKTLQFITHYRDDLEKMQGRETYFVEKIAKGLLDEKLIPDLSYYNDTRDFLKESSPDNYVPIHEIPLRRTSFKKIHTTRRDRNDEYSVGDEIRLAILDAHSDSISFVPNQKIKGIQDIFITYSWGNHLEVSIDDNYKYYPDQLEFALNNGFDSYEDFFWYFFDKLDQGRKAFSGIIIHWTDLKY